MSLIGNRTPVKAPRKSRAPLPRSISVIEPPGPDTDGWCCVEIAVGKQVDRYLLNTIVTDFGNGALAFAVEKLDPDLAVIEAYEVLLAGRQSICDCLGFTAHGRCKHVGGLQELVDKGRLPIARSAGDLARNDPGVHQEHEDAIAGVFGPEYDAYLDTLRYEHELQQPDPAA